MLFWLFGELAAVWLLALLLIVIGTVVWLVGRPLGWWVHRPYGFDAWWAGLTKEQKVEFRRWEVRKRAYSKARVKQSQVCQRLMEERLARTGGDIDNMMSVLEAWILADREIGFCERFGDMVGTPDEPTYHMGPLDDPNVKAWAAWRAKRDALANGAARPPDGVGGSALVERRAMT